MDAYTLCLELFPAGHVCALPPIFFFPPPLCFNYHRTPALWPNYGPGASVNRSARCAPNIPARKRGEKR